MVSWAGGGDRLFPLGQGIGLAATFRKRYGNVAKLVQAIRRASRQQIDQAASLRSEEHTSELQSLMRISYAVFCLKKKNKNTLPQDHSPHTQRHSEITNYR